MATDSGRTGDTPQNSDIGRTETGSSRELQLGNDDSHAVPTGLLSPLLGEAISSQPAQDAQAQDPHVNPLEVMNQEQMSNLFHGARGFNVHGGHFNSIGNMIVNQVPVSDPGLSSSMNARPWNMTYSSPTREEKESETYARLLWPKGRGFPLWCPKPNMNLPAQYLEKGIRIGDVGIITSNGSFDFLFNICLPSQHPINGNRVPAGFQPIDAPDSVDIDSDIEHPPGAYVMSKLIQGQTGPGILSPIGSSNEFRFQCANHEGAILILPEGSFREDLQNLTVFRQYASRNGEAWYQYANGPRGREAINGSLHLVTGYDKGTSWVVAAFSHGTEPRREFSFQFTASLIQMGSNGTNYSYYWNQSGPATVKHGPVPVPRNSNQCVFIRTFSIALNTGIWTKLFGTGLAQVTKSIDMKIDDLFSRTDLVPFRESSSSSPNLTSSGSGTNNRRSQESQDSPADDPSTFPSVIMTPNFPSLSQTAHPTRDINKYLLEKIPAAKIAISHDHNWCSVLSETEEDMPKIEELLHRIERTHDIVCQDDVVFFSDKEKVSTALRMQTSAQQTQATSIDAYEHRNKQSSDRAKEPVGNSQQEKGNDTPGLRMLPNINEKGRELIFTEIETVDKHAAESTDVDATSAMPLSLGDVQETSPATLISGHNTDWMQGLRRPPATRRRSRHGRTRDPQRVRGADSPELDPTSRRSRSASWHSISHWNMSSQTFSESQKPPSTSHEDVIHRVNSESDITRATPVSDEHESGEFWNISFDSSRREKTRRQRIEAEQRRRDEIRDAYSKLKDVLPVSNQKSTKVSLLERAALHIIYLEKAKKEMEEHLLMLEEGVQRLQNEHNMVEKLRGI